jgi:hypothetical protein
MNRRLVLLNLILAALVAVAAWALWQRQRDAGQRETALLAAGIPAVTPPPALSPPPAAAVQPASYVDVAQKMLFSRDRNPDVILEVAPPKSPPPFPRFFGVMDFGSGPSILLAERSGAPQRSFRIGERVGEFRLAALERTALVFEWEGKRLRAPLDEIREKAAPAPVEEAPKPAPAATQSTTVVAPAQQGRPGAERSTTMRYCAPGDNAPHGTVADGYRKVISETPFGRSCVWELIQK